MKDSGIDWITEVPETWECMPYKRLFEEMDRPVEDGDEIITCFRDGEVTLRSNRRVDGFTMADQEIGYQHIAKGDLVVHGMDGFAGSIGISDSDGKATPVLIVLNPLKDAVNRYFMYLLRVYAQLEVFLATSSGIRVRSCALNWKKLGNLPAIVPPHNEQQRIADYLDERCREIDAVKQTLSDEIEALQRLRKATIHKAVTKGLDDSVPMKDSGIHYIGTIPSSWGFIRFRYLCDIATGDHDTQDRTPDGKYPMYVRSPIAERSDTYTFDCEGILMAGDGAGAGRVFHHVNGKYAVHQRVYCFHNFIDDVSTDFLFYYVSNHFDKRMDMGSAQSTVPSVRLHMIKDFPVPFPPLDEQQRIAKYLDERCAAIDSVIETRTKQLERLEDYRKALIFAYVTGKKEVPAA